MLHNLLNWNEGNVEKNSISKFSCYKSEKQTFFADSHEKQSFTCGHSHVCVALTSDLSSCDAIDWQ